ncbi:MAG: tyrosine-protein phosphatase [Bacteroidales bacterium]|nr:tyrosine-protein phosphatase [Bacteroidales bacterium]
MKHLLPAALFALLALVSCEKVPVYNLENPVYKAYLDQVHYDCDDYTYNLVDRYADFPYSSRLDYPEPVRLSWESDEITDSVHVLVKEKGGQTAADYIMSGATQVAEVWNLIPGREYSYVIENLKDGSSVGELASGRFRTEGRRRMLKVAEVNNVRDLGGIRTEDGKTIKYGMIFRGAQLDGLNYPDLSDEGRAILRGLGVKVDIDYRGDVELRRTDEDPDNDICSSVLGDDVEYYNIPTCGIDGISRITLYGQAYKQFVKAAREGKAVYNHCVGGADRTGFQCMLIEGSLGVAEEDAIKDYEATSFCSLYRRTRNMGAPFKVPESMAILKGLEGDTFQAKCCTFLKSQGVTDEEIEEFRSLMLE